LLHRQGRRDDAARPAGSWLMERVDIGPLSSREKFPILDNSLNLNR
jgi:hypothetical protein